MKEPGLPLANAVAEDLGFHLFSSSKKLTFKTPLRTTLLTYKTR